MTELPQLDRFEALAWRLELRRHAVFEALFMARTGKTMYAEDSLPDLVRLLRALATTLEQNKSDNPACLSP
jgi:hypothetical protein